MPPIPWTLEVRPAEAADAEWLTGFLGLPFAHGWPSSDDCWLVAEREGLPVGTVQVLPGRPTAGLLHLRTSSEIDGRSSAYVRQALLDSALKTLGLVGALSTWCFVPFSDRATKRTLKRRFGGRVVESGNWLRMGV